MYMGVHFSCGLETLIFKSLSLYIDFSLDEQLSYLHVSDALWRTMCLRWAAYKHLYKFCCEI